MRWQRQTGAKGTPFILRWAELALNCSLVMRFAFFLMTCSITQFSADVISLMVRMTLILIWSSTRRWLHRVVWSERLRFPKLCFLKSQDVFRMQKGSEQRHISFQLRNVNSEQISLKILVVWSWINIMNTLALLIDMKQNFTCFFDSFFHSFSCCSDQSPLLVR